MTRSDGLQRRRAQRLGAGLGLLHREAVELEAGAQEAPDLDLVVDDEDGGGRFTHRRVVSSRFGVGRHRQMDGDRGAAVGAVAFDLDLAAIGGDEGVGDPQAEPGAGRGRGMARPAEEAARRPGAFPPRVRPDAAIVHRQHHGLAVGTGGDADRRAGRRIFRGIVEDLHQRLLDLRRIDVDDRQVGIQIERHRIAAAGGRGGARTPR